MIIILIYLIHNISSGFELGQFIFSQHHFTFSVTEATTVSHEQGFTRIHEFAKYFLSVVRIIEQRGRQLTRHLAFAYRIRNMRVQ